MNRIFLAFRCFFNLLFHGELSADTLAALNLTRRGAAPVPAKAAAGSGEKLTGTGVVPDRDFTLEPKDIVEIKIDGIGTLLNPIVQG